MFKHAYILHIAELLSDLDLKLTLMGWGKGGSKPVPSSKASHFCVAAWRIRVRLYVLTWLLEEPICRRSESCSLTQQVCKCIYCDTIAGFKASIVGKLGSNLKIDLIKKNRGEEIIFMLVDMFCLSCKWRCAMAGQCSAWRL